MSLCSPRQQPGLLKQEPSASHPTLRAELVTNLPPVLSPISVCYKYFFSLPEKSANLPAFRWKPHTKSRIYYQRTRFEGPWSTTSLVTGFSGSQCISSYFSPPFFPSTFSHYDKQIFCRRCFSHMCRVILQLNLLLRSHEKYTESSAQT